MVYIQTPRYGYNSAIKITKQCSVRSSVNTSNLEYAHKLDESTLRADLAQMNEWDPQGDWSNNPRCWPASSSFRSNVKASNLKPNRPTSRKVNTKQLDRAIQREVNLWREIALKAKSERLTTRKMVDKNALSQQENHIYKSKYVRLQSKSGKQNIRSKIVLLA